MKIRNDFVTNSSSSSFIVEFNEVPKSVEELKELLFNDTEWFYNGYYDEGISTEEISKIIFNDMENGSITLDSLMQELEDARLDGAPKYDYNNNNYAEYNLKISVFLTNYISEHYKNLSNVYVFEYGNDANYTGLEDFDIFENVNCIQVSHH